jgi:hypothetical protein
MVDGGWWQEPGTSHYPPPAIHDPPHPVSTKSRAGISVFVGAFRQGKLLA